MTNRFGPGDSQRQLAEALREQAARVCPPQVVRDAWTDPGAVRSLWSALAPTGLFGLLCTEKQGGLGLDQTYGAAVFTELGRVAAPGALVETVLVAAPLLCAYCPELAARTVDGSVEVAVALGSTDLVPHATTADLFLMDRPGTLVIYRRDEVDVEPVAAVDASRRLGRVVARGSGSALTADPRAVTGGYDAGALGTAAFLVGLASALLDSTTRYVKVRQQFGVPVGSFQAVKHQLADALLRLEFAHPCVHAAAVSMAAGRDDAARDVSLAKAVASDAAEHVARVALQCHGAIAYTVEYDYHLFAKRIWAMARAWGSAAWHRDRIATQLGL